jgi:hypothetical protein
VNRHAAWLMQDLDVLVMHVKEGTLKGESRRPDALAAAYWRLALLSKWGLRLPLCTPELCAWLQQHLEQAVGSCSGPTQRGWPRRLQQGGQLGPQPQLYAGTQLG